MPHPYNHETTGEEVAQDFSEQIRGKVVLTTGVSPGGVGAVFVEIIAKHNPKLLILSARDAAKIKATSNEIAKIAPNVETRGLVMDLSSQESVRNAAAEVNAYSESIDVVVNNGAVMACDYFATPEGVEGQFATNHLGHFLFTNLIINKVLAAGPGARVISVSSDGYRFDAIRRDYNFQKGENYHKWRAYGQSKTAKMLYAISLAEKLGQKGLLSFSVNPGAILGTHLTRHMGEVDFSTMQTLDHEQGNEFEWGTVFYKSKSQGAATHVVAAFDPSIEKFNGRYLSDAKAVPLKDVRPWARDSLEAEKLWALSEELVGQKFDL